MQRTDAAPRQVRVASSRALARTWLVVALLGGCAADKPRATAPEPLVSVPSATAIETQSQAPSATPEARTSPSPKVESCDDYLREYERCEPKLAPSIAAGERRKPSAERAWLEYLEREGTPRRELNEACLSAYRSIEPLCR